MKLTDATAVRVGGTAATKVYLGATQVWPAVTPGGPASATLTIPAGKVASTLTNFVTRVDLGHMPSSWWAALGSNTGGMIRVKSAGTVIPFDVVNCAPALKMGEVFFKATLTTGANTFTIEVVPGATALAATDANGRNAVWADFDLAYIPAGGLINRNGGASISAVGTDPLVGTLTRSPNVVAHQGVAYDAANDTFIVIDTDELVLYSRGWTELARNATPLAATGISGVVHIGDGCVVGGELFVPADDYPSTTVQQIAVFDSTTLAFKRSYNTFASGHQISSICHDGTYFYTVAYNAGPNYLTTIQRWTSAWVWDGTLTTASMSTKQGIVIHNGFFWISRGSDAPFTVERVNLDGTGKVQAMSCNYLASTTGECEGITSDGRDLFHLYDHGATSYVYTLAQQNDPRAGHMFDAGRALQISSLPKRTSWTMGATAMNARTVTYSAGVLSYGDNSTSDTVRAALAIRDAATDRWGIWNSADVWLEDTSVAATAMAAGRVHHTQDGTIDRKLWRDGVLRATDLGVAQRPSSTGDTLFIGTDDTNYNGNWYGFINRVYLRSGVLSADWLAAEYASWETPSSFYTVA